MSTKRAEEHPEKPSETAWGGIWRTVQGFLPAADGTVPVVSAARSRLAWVVATAIGLLLGSACAFVVVLILQAAPGVPGIVIGFGVGAMFGAAASLVFASKYPLVRKGGAFAILLFPVLVLLTPFLLIAAAVALLRKTSPPVSREVRPVKVDVEVVEDDTKAPAKPKTSRAKTRKPRG